MLESSQENQRKSACNLGQSERSNTRTTKLLIPLSFLISPRGLQKGCNGHQCPGPTSSLGPSARRQ
eukprot:1115712-Pelagomonas_calceolata.AAC.8